MFGWSDIFSEIWVGTMPEFQEQRNVLILPSLLGDVLLDDWSYSF